MPGNQSRGGPEIDRPDWWRERVSAAAAVRFVAVYLAVVWLTVHIAGNGDVLPWFPPVGLSLAAAIIYGWRAAPLILVADTAQLIARDAGGGIAESFAQGLTQAVLWTLIGLIIREQLMPGPVLGRLRDAAWLVLAGVFGGSALASTAGLAVLDFVGQAEWTFSTAATYFVGDAIGIVAVTPTVLLLQAQAMPELAAWRHLRATLTRGAEGWAMATATVAAPLTLVPLAGGDLLALMPFPMAWIALRRGMPAVAPATLVWALVAAVTYRYAGTDVSLEEISSTLAAGGLFALLAGAVVAERERGRARLAYLALWDGTTGLQNRHGITDAVERVLRQSARRDVAVLMVRVQLPGGDQAGHIDTEMLLHHAATAIVRATTPDSTIARFGGGEFAVFIEGRDAQRAGGLADALLTELRRPARIEQREYLLEPAIGIVRAPQAKDLAAGGAQSVLDAAEQAARAAGHEGGAVDFGEELAGTLKHDRWMARALGRALEADELHLVYQPIVALEGGKPLAAEALLRWTDPERGPVGPAEFIPVAERCGLILPIGRWVLREACRAAASWPRGNGTAVVLHVNVSPVQLHDENLAPFVGEVLEETGLAPHLLCLELTESALFEDLDVAARRIDQLTKLGVRVVLDDFGTGASSLSWLQRLPVSALKVDRSFVDGIEQHGIDWAIVSATLGLAQSIHVGTVAEGVERPEQLAMLSELGCLAVQGYLISRPVPGAEFEAWLGEHRNGNGNGSAGPSAKVVQMPPSRRSRGHH